MNIRIPRWLVRACDVIANWTSVPIYERGWIRIVRVDILLVFFFFVCTGYYYWTSGWMGALQGGALYIFIALCAAWFF
jgi:uncharacterized membrane protein